jgi:hypothetical protein
VVEKIRRTGWAWRAFGVLLVALGLAAIAYGLTRHGDFPSLETYAVEGGGTILMGCGSIFDNDGCDTYNATAWFAVGGAAVFAGLVVAALARPRWPFVRRDAG